MFNYDRYSISSSLQCVTWRGKSIKERLIYSNNPTIYSITKVCTKYGSRDRWHIHSQYALTLVSKRGECFATNPGKSAKEMASLTQNLQQDSGGLRMGNSVLYDNDLILQTMLNNSGHSIFVISLKDDTIHWSSCYQAYIQIYIDYRRLLAAQGENN